MSIMSEYETIKKVIGEAEYKMIEQFLRLHPEYLLSDILYSRSFYKEYEQWKKSEIEKETL